MSNQNLDLNNNQSEGIKMDSDANIIDARKRINVLVIETDLEIQHLYKQFFNAMTSYVSYSIVNDIEELDNGNNDLKDTNSILTYPSVFDTIIIDLKMKHEKSMTATFIDDERHRFIAFLSNDISKTQPYVFSSDTYSSSKSSNGPWIIDSGATDYISKTPPTPDGKCFKHTLLNYLMEIRPKFIRTTTKNAI